MPNHRFVRCNTHSRCPGTETHHPMIRERFETMSTKKVLIADDDHDLSRVLALRCESLGLQTLVAHDAMAALTTAHAEMPDLICLDVNMPGGSGLSACEMISHSKELTGIPVIILTGRYDEDTIKRCHNMCAYYVLKCPDVWTRVEPLVRELLQMGPPEGDPGKSDEKAKDTAALAGVYREIAHDVAYAQLDDPECANV